MRRALRVVGCVGAGLITLTERCGECSRGQRVNRTEGDAAGPAGRKEPPPTEFGGKFARGEQD